MIGAIINATAILAGGILGLLFRGKISKEISGNIIRIIGICVCIIGISGALEGDFMLLVISLTLGTFAGEFLNIDGRLNKFGIWTQSKLKRGDENADFAEGFVAATLLFCVGAMAIIGSIESGMRDDRSIILTKSILDGVSAMILASSFGFGVLLSAAAVLVYQGSIEFFAGYLQNVLTNEMITQISAVGGIMIVGIGLNMALKTEIKVANFLPGFAFATAYYLILG
ncbi:MAG: DUF554 domain-containing protein [Oscillospiraceae bacterium]|nr:DUF554 domain-containing protein [Oscillospiraceae bacterium]